MGLYTAYHNFHVVIDGYCVLEEFLESENDEKQYADSLDHIKKQETDKKCHVISAERIDKICNNEKGGDIAGALVVWKKTEWTHVQ